ncbi:glycosyltransferase [Luteococcus sp. Sow4_B9]|uniref:glycosyltransferase n=1 Tax=Luteococcus sp. Sow4_B9 TaxID=3438792 RepID=UPI003F968B0E
MPLLTVIMSGYRSGDTIAAATRSTLRAMPKDSELIITIDGPDEPTLAGLDGIEDRRLKVRPDPVNKGLARQLINMTDTTDSRYLARMDSDDICLPWRFAVSLPSLRRDDFVFTSAIRFGEGMKPRASYPGPLNAYETGLSLLFFNPLFHPSMVCRRDALEEVGGYRPIRYGEDNELWLRAAAAGKRLSKVPVPSICYRLSPGQMSAAAGVDERMMAEPAFRTGYQGLADRLGMGDRVQSDCRLALRPGDQERLLAPVRPANKSYLRRQMDCSTMVHRQG